MGRRSIEQYLAVALQTRLIHSLASLVIWGDLLPQMALLHQDCQWVALGADYVK